MFFHRFVSNLHSCLYTIIFYSSLTKSTYVSDYYTYLKLIYMKQTLYILGMDLPFLSSVLRKHFINIPYVVNTYINMYHKLYDNIINDYIFLYDEKHSDDIEIDPLLFYRFIASIKQYFPFVNTYFKKIHVFIFCIYDLFEILEVNAYYESEDFITNEFNKIVILFMKIYNIHNDLYTETTYSFLKKYDLANVVLQLHHHGDLDKAIKENKETFDFFTKFEKGVQNTFNIYDNIETEEIDRITPYQLNEICDDYCNYRRRFLELIFIPDIANIIAKYL